MTGRTALLAAVLVTVTLAPAPAEAQFSSDIPGVPRAAVSFRGGMQSRTEWTFAGFKIPTEGIGVEGDTLGGGLRLSLGRSYRIATAFELGFDLTLADGLYVRPPEEDGLLDDDTDRSYLRGVTLYGLRVGAKWRPFSDLDPDGYGWEIAVGAAIQPGVKPLFGIERYADSTRTGGQFIKDEDDEGVEDPTPGLLPVGDPFGSIHTATFITGMGSYRTQRLLVDLALVAEAVTGGDDDAADTPSPLVKYDGISPRIGVMYRLRPNIALGASYWGTGAPPWRDEIWVGVPGEQKKEQYGFTLTLGSRPESGTDLMVSSPTGNWTESARLYIRMRATR